MMCGQSPILLIWLSFAEEPDCDPGIHCSRQAFYQSNIDSCVGSMQFLGPVQVARRSDMDMNGHINNAAYLAWALETVPKDVFDSWQLTSVSHLCTFARFETLKVYKETTECHALSRQGQSGDLQE